VAEGDGTACCVRGGGSDGSLRPSCPQVYVDFEPGTGALQQLGTCQRASQLCAACRLKGFDDSHGQVAGGQSLPHAATGMKITIAWSIAGGSADAADAQPL
jgi:hypothetical protein